MTQTEKQPIKVAILDLYDGVENEGMRGFREILQRYKAKNDLNLSFEVFDVRQKVELPGTEFDIYISSGGPGSPIDSEGTEWEKKYFRLIDSLEDHNLSNTQQKKYGFFVCHAFQLMCRKYRLGDINMMITKKGPIFFGDTTVNVNPSVQDLVDITVLIEHSVRQFNIKPRVAILSYSNFGSNEGIIPEKTREAVRILHEKYPDMVIDGDMQANFALNSDLLADNFPFSTLIGKPANTLIFPNLESGNIAYKLLQEMGGAEAVGPILLGLKKPVHVLQLGSSVREIVNMITIAVVDAQEKEAEEKGEREKVKGEK